MQDDRSSNVGGQHSGTGDGAAAEDRSGERKLHLSAKSLAARGDALDASEDGRTNADDEEDGRGA